MEVDSFLFRELRTFDILMGFCKDIDLSDSQPEDLSVDQVFWVVQIIIDSYLLESIYFNQIT